MIMVTALVRPAENVLAAGSLFRLGWLQCATFVVRLGMIELEKVREGPCVSIEILRSKLLMETHGDLSRK